MEDREYHPLHTLKLIAPELWVVDGPSISFFGFHFPTRMVVCRLTNKKLWIHSPISLTPELKTSLEKLGEVTYIIAPNTIHYWYMPKWQSEYPNAYIYADNKTVKRAKKHGRSFTPTHQLSNRASDVWHPDITQWSLTPEEFISEVLFFHHPTHTLIVTDFFENFEANKLPWIPRQLIRLAGALAPNGSTTIDQRWFYRRHQKHLQKIIWEISTLKPKNIIMAHGAIVKNDAEEFFTKATSWINSN